MNATTEQLNLAQFLRELRFTCVEIGLTEIETAARHDVSQICTTEITAITAKAILNRPEHVTDILLVSSWMITEAGCADAQRDLIRQHYLTIAQSIENALS